MLVRRWNVLDLYFSRRVESLETCNLQSGGPSIWAALSAFCSWSSGDSQNDATRSWHACDTIFLGTKRQTLNFIHYFRGEHYIDQSWWSSFPFAAFLNEFVVSGLAGEWAMVLQSSCLPSTLTRPETIQLSAACGHVPHHLARDFKHFKHFASSKSQLKLLFWDGLKPPKTHSGDVWHSSVPCWPICTLRARTVHPAGQIDWQVIFRHDCIFKQSTTSPVCESVSDHVSSPWSISPILQVGSSAVLAVFFFLSLSLYIHMCTHRHIQYLPCVYVDILLYTYTCLHIYIYIIYIHSIYIYTYTFKYHQISSPQ